MKMDVTSLFTGKTTEGQNASSSRAKSVDKGFSDMFHKTTQAREKATSQRNETDAQNTTGVDLKGPQVKPSTVDKKDSLDVLDKTTSSSQSKNMVQVNEMLSVFKTEGNGFEESKVIESVASMLDLSKEELEDYMEKLGLAPMDLLQMENIQQIVLAQHGAESLTDALTNEALSATLQQVTQELGTLADYFQSLKEVMDPTMATDDTMTEIAMPTVKHDNQENDIEMNSLDNAEVNSPEEKQIDMEINHDAASFRKEENSERQVSNTSNDKDKPITKSEAVNLFVEQLSQIQETSSMDTTDVQMPEIVNQIVDKIKMEIGPQKTSIELHLNPEHLGNVQVTVSAKEGALTAQFHVQNQMTKQAIEANMELLKESFEGQGVKVDEVEVVISNYTSQYGQEQQREQQGQQQQHTRKRRMLGDLDLGSMGTEENVTVVTDNPNGTVSYTV